MTCARDSSDSKLNHPRHPAAQPQSRAAGARYGRCLAAKGICREAELKALHELKVKADCELTLAIAFLPQKEYLLIYRADNTRIDYYQFQSDRLHCHLLKRRDVIEHSDDSHQLKLGMKVR